MEIPSPIVAFCLTLSLFIICLTWFKFLHFYRNRAGDIYSGYNELSVSQHDVLRDLALHMNNREPLNARRRLVMPRREDGLPKDWKRNKDNPFEARIVSIHTGIACKLLHPIIKILCIWINYTIPFCFQGLSQYKLVFSRLIL